MKLLSLSLFTLPLCLAFGQDSAPGDQAPADVDQALRARVTQFYTANITGKWRDAFAVVADDMQDTYLASSKDRYDRCDTVKITYSDNFAKATVRENCHGEYRWHNSHLPATIPLTSTWKVVDGQWFWYFVEPTEVMTPWGLSKVTPDAPAKSTDVNAKVQSVLKDPAAMAKAILNQVKVDKKEISLRGYEASNDELHITNAMSGTVSVDVSCPPLPGFHIKQEKADVGPNETAAIHFEYDPEDAKKQCGDCYKLAKPKLTAYVSVMPTMQRFPIKIYFAIPPELEKKIPKELRQHPSQQKQ